MSDKCSELAPAARESRVGELAGWRFIAFFPIYIECGVDREVHATAGQEAGATGSLQDAGEPLTGVGEEICGDLLGGAFGDDLAAGLAAFWT